MRNGWNLGIGGGLLAGMVGVSTLAAAAAAPAVAPTAPPTPLSTKAQQVLAARCFSCHGPQAQLGGLRLDSAAAALKGGKSGLVVTPGHPEKSLLVKAIGYDGKLKMPPAGKLSVAEIETLTQWVKQGASWTAKAPVAAKTEPGKPKAGSLWAFAPVRSPKIPTVKAKAWVKTPIDAFILAELERRGLKPSPYADRRTLIRRVYLDLVGLPPTPKEVDAFVADRSPNAWEKVVDHLLGSPHFGERLALFWLDQARYADSDGYHDDTDRTQWGYRDYVIKAFNEDKPFDIFTVEQIAGDLFPDASVEQKVASAFNRSGPTTSEGGAIPEEVMNAYAVDRVNTTASVWLGLTIQCAQCHDHKYDPLTQRDFYQLAAYFNQVPEQALYRGPDAPPTIPYPTEEQQREMDTLAAKIAALEPEAKPRADAPDAKAEEARLAEAKKKLQEARNAHSAIQKNSTIRIMADVPTRRPTHLLMRGDYRSPGVEVKPNIPAVFGSLPADAPQNRIALARWLVDPKQPLTGRVTVNRFWQLIYGSGLSKSSDDLGTRGEPPSHPELLDWLASWFTARESAKPSGAGWSTKSLLRLIVMSATYQQSSRATPELLAKDPANRLLARGPRFRLSAELIRDNALAISGLMTSKVGGPSVKPYQPGDLWRELSAGDQEGKSYVQDHGPALYRRGLYVVWKRSVLYPAFAVFDASKREVCILNRPITNTPLQAFVTLNDTTYVEAARVLAQRVMQEGGIVPDTRLTHAMRLAVGRAPNAVERKALISLYQSALAQYRADVPAATKLASAGESPRPATLDVSEHAAWTCVCNAILNLDETISKE